MPTFYKPYRYLLLTLTLLLFSSILSAQPTDVQISTDNPPGPNPEQHWPSVMVRNGTVYAVWGQQRLDTVTQINDTWYSTGVWSKRTSPSVQLLKEFRLENIPAANDRPRHSLYQSMIGNLYNNVFDGLWVLGTTQLRGDIANAAPIDTVYTARFTLYIATGADWKPVVVKELKQTGGLGVAMKSRQIGYNPNTGELLTAWMATNEQTGHVSSVDTNGVRWEASQIPFPARGTYYLVPLKDKEFLLIVDSVAMHFDNGLPRDTMILPKHEGLRYQRISGDRFIRSYISDDSTKYVFEIYNINGTKEKTMEYAGEPIQPGYFLPGYFLTENVSAEIEDEVRFALVTGGKSGVHMQLLREDFNVIGALETVSGSAMFDSTKTPALAARFKDDSVYVVWEDYRNANADIYGRAVSYRPPTTHGVNDAPEAGRHVTLDAVTPNPTTGAVGFEVTLPRPSAVDLEIIDLMGRVVGRESREMMGEGRSTIQLDLAGLASGTYRVILRAGAQQAAGTVVVVH